MVTPESIGKTIIKLRKLKGLSQETLAVEAGVDRRYMSDVENGKRNISLDLLNRIASYFGMSLSHFIENADDSIFRFNNAEEVRVFLLERDEQEASFFVNPDYAQAIIGIDDDGRLIYSYSKMVECLMLSDSMEYEDAVEFIDYNTIRTVPYMGKKSPIILYDIH